MRRREFTVLLGGAVAWPLVARAQQSVIPKIGFLSPVSATTSARNIGALRRACESWAMWKVRISRSSIASPREFLSGSANWRPNSSRSSRLSSWLDRRPEASAQAKLRKQYR